MDMIIRRGEREYELLSGNHGAVCRKYFVQDALEFQWPFGSCWLSARQAFGNRAGEDSDASAVVARHTKIKSPLEAAILDKSNSRLLADVQNLLNQAERHQRASDRNRDQDRASEVLG